MASKQVTKRPATFAGLLAVASLVLAACGAPSSANTSSRPTVALTSPPATPTAVPAVQVAPSPTVALAQLPLPTPAQSVGNPASLVAKGELIFQKTAGGVGCQYCHGADARGKEGPNIRGKSAGAIKQALGIVIQMAFISQKTPLSDEDIEAVAAYLKYLASQP